MTYSASQKKATDKYKSAHYKRIPLDVPIEFYDKVKAAADAAGQSVNGYIKSAIEEKIEIDR